MPFLCAGQLEGGMSRIGRVLWGIRDARAGLLLRTVCACSQRNGPSTADMHRGHGPLNVVIPRMCVCGPGGQQTRELIATRITPLYLQLMHVGRCPSKKLLITTVINHWTAERTQSDSKKVIDDRVVGGSFRKTVCRASRLVVDVGCKLCDDYGFSECISFEVSKGGCARCAWTREPLGANLVYRLLSCYAMTVVRFCKCDFMDSTKLIIKIEI